MPELPEVETIRRDLEQVVVGRQVASVSITGMRAVRRQPSALVVERVTGRSVSAVRRHGKFLLVDLDGDVTLVIHLRMSGQLLWSPDPSAPVIPHTHARLQFFEGEQLLFVDPRTFGEWWVTSPDVPELSHLGPDAWTNLPVATDLAQRMQNRRSALKLLLVNQEIVAGIGYIYADEILWEARLRPERRGVDLSRQLSHRLRDAVETVLTSAITARGSSLKDQQYVDLYGSPGDAQRRHQVYARAGEPCVRCGSVIVRLPLGMRSAFSCRRCQR